MHWGLILNFEELNSSYHQEILIIKQNNILINAKWNKFNSSIKTVSITIKFIVWRWFVL